jgi:hypothetical protein
MYEITLKVLPGGISSVKCLPYTSNLFESLEEVEQSHSKTILCLKKICDTTKQKLTHNFYL